MNRRLLGGRYACGRFLSHTLLAAEVQAGVISQACDAAMEFLVSNRFVVSMARAGDSEGVRDDQRLSAVAELSPTQLGKVRAKISRLWHGASPNACRLRSEGMAWFGMASDSLASVEGKEKRCVA